MMKFFSRFRKDESGATAIEYGLIAALIAVVVVAAMTALGGQIQTTFGEIGGTVRNAQDTDIPNAA
jgi:pilus assembly protein Flp/PilA